MISDVSCTRDFESVLLCPGSWQRISLVAPLTISLCSTNSFYQKQILAAGDGKAKKLEPYRPNAPRNRAKKEVSLISAGARA